MPDGMTITEPEAAVLAYGVERGSVTTGMVRDAAALPTRQNARRLIGQMLGTGLLCDRAYGTVSESHFPGVYDVTDKGRAALTAHVSVAPVLPEGVEVEQ